jgi:peptidoglycan biosynthesis protein MviN/MurJ (putative lipid II flippase)
MLTMLHFEWSRAASVGSLRGRDVVQNARRLGTMAVIGSLLAIALAPWLVDLMYGHGLMTVQARHDLSVLLRAYLIGTGPFLASVIYVRALSATGKIHVITLVAVASVLANAFLDWYLIGFFGSAGIGLSTSIVYLISLFILHNYWCRSEAGMVEVDRDGV